MTDRFVERLGAARNSSQGAPKRHTQQPSIRPKEVAQQPPVLPTDTPSTPQKPV